MHINQLMAENNIVILYSDELKKVRGLSYSYGDKTFVILNSKLSFHQQIDTMIHELKHIIEKDFDKVPEFIEDIEYEAKKNTSIIDFQEKYGIHLIND